MTIVIMPSFDCNFRCKYCYLYNSTKLRTDNLTADFVCSILLQLNSILPANHKKVKIIWHGGEPLLWGHDNFLQVFDYIQCELPDLIVSNSIQSNLSLIEDKYIDVFKNYNVKVGFSFDGPKEINDACRVFANGKGSSSNILNKVMLCNDSGLKMGCVAVCSHNYVGKIKQVYDYFNALKLDFKLNPLFITGEAANNKDELGVTATEYAEIMVELYDIMINDPNNSIVEDNLLEMASAVATGNTEHCLFGYNCQDNFLAIAPTGDVMPCGRFCDNDLLQYSYGNLHKETLAEILLRIKQSETYKRAEYIAQSGCAKCKWYNICHGGCLHDGFLASGDFRHKTFLCSAYKKIFAHIEKRLKESGIERKN